MKGKVAALFAWAFAFLFLASVVLAGATLDYGQLTGIPPDGGVTYVAYLAKTSGEEILTEDSYNAGLGTDQGYQSGYWFLSVVSFDSAQQGDKVQIHFAGIGAQAGKAGNSSFSWDGTGGFTDHGTVTFGPGAGSAVPTELLAKATGKEAEIELTWVDRTAGMATYRLYRSTQPSGFANDASNGHYYRVDPFEYECLQGACTGLDTAPSAGRRNWYLVVAGEPWSGHSNESWAVPGVAFPSRVYLPLIVGD